MPRADCFTSAAKEAVPRATTRANAATRPHGLKCFMGPILSGERIARYGPPAAARARLVRSGLALIGNDPTFPGSVREALLGRLEGRAAGSSGRLAVCASAAPPSTAAATATVAPAADVTAAPAAATVTEAPPL